MRVNASAHVNTLSVRLWVQFPCRGDDFSRDKGTTLLPTRLEKGGNL